MRRVFGVLVLVAAAVGGLWAWEHHKQAVVIKELNARLEYSGTHRPIKRVVW